MAGRTAKLHWTPAHRKLRALSVRQPYAWLIVNGYKDVENRSRATSHRGALLIHAGLRTANLKEERLRNYERQYRVKLPGRDEYELGGIVGMVDVVGCTERSNSPWYDPDYIGWTLANPRRLSFRRCKGALNLFKPKFDKP